MDHVIDITVVGAGIEGSATAYQLSKMTSGKKIALVEQFNAVHTRGCSAGESRVTRMGYNKSLYTAMMKECFSLWGELELESGREIYVPCGQITFGPVEASSLWSVQGVTDSLNEQGLPYELIDATETKRRYPFFKKLPENFKSLVEENAGILKVPNALKAFQEQFVKNGGILLENCKVEKIVPGTSVKLYTSKGIITTRHLIITAGAWAPKLLKSIGLNLPMEVVRLDVLYWPMKKMYDHMPVFMYHSGIEGKLKDDIYGIPPCEYSGLMKICSNGGPATDPDVRDLVPGASSVSVVSDFIGTFFNFIDTKPSIVESCMYTATPDRDFIMDRHPSCRNIIIGAGFSGHGFKLAPVVGKILSELALDLPPSYNLEPFAIDRFPAQSKL